MLRIAAGLETLQRGRVLMGDAPVADDRAVVPPEERGVGLVFQDYALFPHLSVLDNVAFGLRGRATQDKRARALEVLRQVGMDRSSPTRMVSSWSRRIVVLTAFCSDPHRVGDPRPDGHDAWS